MNNELEIMGKGIVHYVDSEFIYASYKNQIFKSEDDGGSWQLVCKIPISFWQSVFGFFILLRRIFRLQIFHVLPISNGVLIVGYKKIVKHVFQVNESQNTISSIVGSRPLTICQDCNGVIYYGEYRSNKERAPVNIYASKDEGASWQIVYSMSGVRHIHGVFNDAYTDSIWVTTGDSDAESALWVTKNGFKSLEKVVFGSQQTRAVQLLFSKDYIYFGSDTPLEQNYLYRFHREALEVKRLQKVEGSIFFGVKIREQLCFSTVVEPSFVNTSKNIVIWQSVDGKKWKQIAVFKKDFLPTKIFQYGQVFFPIIKSVSDYLWFTPFATNKHNRIMRMKL